MDGQPDPPVGPSPGPGPFVYTDSASTRAGIEAVSRRLAGGSVAVLGLGGTGSYVLDLVAKTPVSRIVLVDGDRLEPHNAYRAPGAMSLEEVSARTAKVDHFARVYGRMHTGIEAHAEHLTSANVQLLDGLDFAFCCVDGVKARRFIVPALEERSIPFVDAGLGLSLVDDAVLGMVRVTTSTPSMSARDRIPMVAGDGELYRSNIQVACMNALAASLAVMRWKRLAGFYVDLEGEYNSTFSVDGNHLRNDDHLPSIAGEVAADRPLLAPSDG